MKSSNAKEQCNQWQEIADYMELLIKGGGKRTYDDDNVIEVPKMRLAYLGVDFMESFFSY